MSHAAQRSAERCFTQKHPQEGFALLRWLRYARKYQAGASLLADLQTKLAKCLVFKLTFQSTISEASQGYGYYYELRSTAILRGNGGMRAEGSAPLSWHDVHWTAGGPCDVTVAGGGSTLNAAGGQLGLSITPVSRTSPSINYTLRYDPGTPTETTTIACPKTPPLVSTTTAWITYFTTITKMRKRPLASARPSA